MLPTRLTSTILCFLSFFAFGVLTKLLFTRPTLVAVLLAVVLFSALAGAKRFLNAGPDNALYASSALLSLVVLSAINKGFDLSLGVKYAVLPVVTAASVTGVAFFFAMCSWWFASHLGTPRNRVITATALYTLFACVSLPIASLTGIVSFSSGSYFGVPSAAFLGSVLAGLVLSMVGEVFKPRIPGAVLEPCLVLVGGVAGVAAIQNALLPLLLCFVLAAMLIGALYD